MKARHFIYKMLAVFVMLNIAITSVYADVQCVKYAEYQGYSIVESNGRQGIVTADGEVVIAPEYDLVSFLDCGTIRVVAGGKWGLFQSNGEMILAPQYDAISMHNTAGYAYYTLNGKFGGIFGTEILTEPIFDTIDALEFTITGITDSNVLGYDEQDANPITFITDMSATHGYDVDAITGTLVDVAFSSYDDFIAFLQSIYRATEWYQKDEDGRYVPLTDLAILDIYPYFKRGITMHDYYENGETGGIVVYMNPYGEIIQAAPMNSDGAWTLWEMEW